MFNILKIQNKLDEIKKNRKGFTLMEIVVVMAVIAILVLLAMPDLRNTIFSSKKTACQSDIRTMGDAIVKYYAEIGSMPEANDISGLREILINKKEVNGTTYGPWMKKNMSTKDPWGNEYEVDLEDPTDFDIISKGPNPGQADSEIRYTTLGTKEK